MRELVPGGVGLETAEDFGARVRQGLGVQRIALLVSPPPQQRPPVCWPSGTTFAASSP